jgi:hypothetical protein
MKFTTHLELHSQTTRLVEGALRGSGRRSQTGLSPSVTRCSKRIRPPPQPKLPLQITTRAPPGPDFKFELMPLHSPLLRQSLLVSFPPLIDMLKFSGYPYLIRGQLSVCLGTVPDHRRTRAKGSLRLRRFGAHHDDLGPAAGAAAAGPTQAGLDGRE